MLKNFKQLVILTTLGLFIGCAKPINPLVRYWKECNAIALLPPKTIGAGSTLRLDDQAVYSEVDGCFNFPTSTIKNTPLDLPSVKNKTFQDSEIKISALDKAKLLGRFKKAEYIDISYSNAQSNFILIKDLDDHLKEECSRKLKDFHKWIVVQNAISATAEYKFLDSSKK